MIKKVVVIISLFFSINVYAETTVCDGKFENGYPVHVVVDWNKNTVKVNGTENEILTILSENQAIVTKPYINKYGRKVAFIIREDKSYYRDFKGDLYFSGKTSTFITQVDVESERLNGSFGLTCSQSFVKPLMRRMISSY